MAELPTYPTDAAMCRLLAEGPLPSTAIADRLAMPDRTVRHRLSQLRRAGLVVSGDDGLHRLAGALPALAVASAGPAAAPVTGAPAVIAPGGKETAGGNRVPTTLPGGYLTGLAVLAVVGIGLAAVAIRRRPPDPPPPPVVDPGDWGPWTGW
jgi:DNA-binding Lrp family transcriptional regulator